MPKFSLVRIKNGENNNDRQFFTAVFFYRGVKKHDKFNNINKNKRIGIDNEKN